MSYTSREAYGAQPTPLTARGPDPRAASLVADTLAQNLAQVSQQFGQLWGAMGQAQTVNAASGATAKASMRAIDMEKGFAADPEPGTVPQRFPEAAAKLRAEILDGLDPAVANHVARAFDSQIMPNTYRQVIGIANHRHIGNLRGAEAVTRGTQAQNFATASDEAQGQILGALKASIAGNVAAGIYDQAYAAPLLSNTLRQAITIRAAGADAGAPLAAQAMLDRFKGEMDAGDVALVTTHLRAPVERATGEGVATRNIRAAAPVGSINDAILAQESGGRDVKPSIDGARGLMQIVPGTWAQYARPGEKIDNAADNRAVGDRIIADLSAKSGGDPARIAVGYFSGPGNIAPPGSPNPWKEDRKDGNGKTVSSYVGDVMARLQPSNATQRDTAMAGVDRDLADAPLHVRLSAKSHVAAHYTQLEHQYQQARAVLNTEIKDLSASYGAGNTGAAIPEARIRALAPTAEAAQRTIDELTLTRTAGDSVRASAFASPADEAALRANLAGNPADTRMAGERQHAVAVFDQALRQKYKAASEDPHGYASTAPEVRALREGGAPLPQIIAASLAVQTRLGLPPVRQRVLDVAQTETIAAMLRTTGPETADMGATLAGIAQQFGPELWNRAYGELVQHGKIGWEWQAVAAMSHPSQAGGRADLQKALVVTKDRGAKALDDQIAPDKRKEIDQKVWGAMAKFQEATILHPGGASLYDTMHKAVELLTKWNMRDGTDAGKAAESAYQSVIGARFDTAGDDRSGTFLSGRPTMLVPKGEGGRIEAGLALVLSTLTAADIKPLADPGRPKATDAELRAPTFAAAQRGVWINNADMSGVVLMGRTVGGGLIGILAGDGKPIEVLFADMPATLGVQPAAPPRAERLYGDETPRNELEFRAQQQAEIDAARQARRAAGRTADTEAPDVNLLQKQSEKQVARSAVGAAAEQQVRGWAERLLRRPKAGDDR